MAYIVTDIQGVNDFYTDPQIHTKSGKGFGEGNLGQTGIHQFIKTHTCNPLCKYLNLEPLNNSNSSRRMLLRGTLPVVQLEFNKESQSAVIKDGSGDEEDGAGVQHPLQPSAAPSKPAREDSTQWPGAQPPPNSALDMHATQSRAEVQHPLQPKAATETRYYYHNYYKT